VSTLNRPDGLGYRAFGLTIRSQIPLPELGPYELAGQKPDVEIVLGDVRSLWERLGARHSHFAYVDRSYYLHIHDTAVYRVAGGEVTVDPMQGCCMKKLRLYLLGSCMGVLLLNRGVLPLHGSAVVAGNKAYAIVGESGAGKSTLAAALLSRGYRLLTDDVIPVVFGEQTGIASVVPAYPQQKLWEESIDGLHMSARDYETLYEHRSRAKFAIPVHEHFAEVGVPLAGIIELNRSDDDTIRFQRIEGLERVPVLFQHTYRNYHLPMLGLLGWHFQMSTRIAEQIELFRLSRPSSGFTVNEIVAIVTSEIVEGVTV